jgi:hypothetical protein
MRAGAIVVVAPTFDLFAGLAERIERVLVQTFISKLAIKAFNVRILRRLPGAM